MVKYWISIFTTTLWWHTACKNAGVVVPYHEYEVKSASVVFEVKFTPFTLIEKNFTFSSSSWFSSVRFSFLSAYNAYVYFLSLFYIFFFSFFSPFPLQFFNRWNSEKCNIFTVFRARFFTLSFSRNLVKMRRRYVVDVPFISRMFVASLHCNSARADILRKFLANWAHVLYVGGGQAIETIVVRYSVNCG